MTSELRRQAKAINFGIIYGMSPFGLSRQLDISQKMAKVYIDNYFARYEGVHRFVERTIKEAVDTMQTSTLLGPHPIAAGHTERECQRSSVCRADGRQHPYSRIGRRFDQNRDDSDRCGAAEKQYKTAMLLSVHDELVFEVPPDELEPVKELIRSIMEGVWELKVPLKVNMAWGANWAEVH